MIRFDRKQKGFTLIELLIVVAIIGILAAIAIPNLLTAMQRSKQKRTMADMRSIATAWEAYSTDNNAYSAAGQAATTQNLDWASLKEWKYASLAAIITPTYIRSAPSQDGWNNGYDYAVDVVKTGKAQQYAIRSFGKDGAAHATDYEPQATTVFECDIVFSLGAFVVYPQGAQTASTN